MTQPPSDAVSKPAIVAKVDALALRLRRRQVVGSHAVAVEVVNLLYQVVLGAKFHSFDLLLDHIRDVGDKLEQAGPKEFVIANMVNRVLKSLREEYATALSREQALSTPLPATPGSIAATPAGLASDSASQPSDFFTATAARRRIVVAPMSPSRSSSTSMPSSPTTATTPGISFGGTATPPSSVAGAAAPLTMFDLLGHRGSLSHLASSHASVSPHEGSSPRHEYSFTPTISPALSRAASSAQLMMMRHELGGGSGAFEDAFSRRSHELRPFFREAVEELMEELESVRDRVSGYAADHIHPAEIILTIGNSRTVEAFLRAAARKRKFTVIVAETAPFLTGRTLARNLAEAGIDTVLIPDACIFALMPRCSKVVIGTHAVLADGSLLAGTGALLAAQSAKAHLVPVVVCSGMYKFCAHFLAGDDLLGPSADLGSPLEVLPEAADGDFNESGADCEVISPYYDRVPADLVSLFNTNLGGHPSSMVYRLLSDLYA